MTDHAEQTPDRMNDASLAHALAGTFTPDELDRLGLHLAAPVEHQPAETIAPVLARLLDATVTGREMHAAILADGAHAVGCHASPLTHAEDCECWCHRYDVADADGFGAVA